MIYSWSICGHSCYKKLDFREWTINAFWPSGGSMSEANANRVKSRVSVLIFMINSWSIYGHLCSQKQPAFQVSYFSFLTWIFVNYPWIVINNYYFCRDSASPQGMGGSRHIGFRVSRVPFVMGFIPWRAHRGAGKGRFLNVIFWSSNFATLIMYKKIPQRSVHFGRLLPLTYGHEASLCHSEQICHFERSEKSRMVS